MPRRPFSKLCSSLLCAYCSNKLPERGPSKTRLRVLSITQLRAWAHRESAYAQLSPLYLLSTLYVTHVIKYSRPSTTFPYFKRRKAGRGLGTRLPFSHPSCLFPSQLPPTSVSILTFCDLTVTISPVLGNEPDMY